MTRYLVTGATGFLGGYVTRRLLEQGHEVTALCRAHDAATAALGATVVVGDILDEGSVRRAAEGCAGAFHCAGKVSRKPEDAELLFRVNVDGTKNVLSASKAAGVKRAVVASTSGTIAISKKSKPLDETAPAPLEHIGRFPYYRAKLYAEQHALEQSGPDFEVVSVNPSLLLGPGDLHGSSTGDIELFLEGKVPVAPAGGISFVDARDAATAMVAAMERGKPGSRYLLTAANMTVDAFLGRLSRISGVARPAVKAPKSVTLAKVGASLLDRAKKYFPIDGDLDSVSVEMGQLFWYCDSRKAERELGFAPRDPNETLADTIADLHDRGVVWPRKSA